MATYPLHEFSKFPLYPDFPQPPTGFPTRQTLDIGEIKYEAPNFVSTHATPKILADTLDLEFKNLSPLEGIEYPDLMAPEMEITVPVMTVKSQAADEAGIARDIVAEVKRELVKSANLFAQLHRMNYEKTGEWPEWYNERWAPIYRKAVLWEAEFVHHEDPFAALPPDLRGEEGEYSEDRSNLLLAQLLMRTGETHQLEALRQRMGWEDEFVAGLRPLAKKTQAAEEAPQNKDNPSPQHMDEKQPAAGDMLKAVPDPEHEEAVAPPILEPVLKAESESKNPDSEIVDVEKIENALKDDPTNMEFDAATDTDLVNSSGDRYPYKDDSSVPSFHSIADMEQTVEPEQEWEEPNFFQKGFWAFALPKDHPYHKYMREVANEYVTREAKPWAEGMLKWGFHPLVEIILWLRSKFKGVEEVDASERKEADDEQS